MLEAQLLSKIIDENSFYTLNKFNISQNDFHAIPHVYEYVRDYVKEYGQTPDYRNVVARFKDFDYQVDVQDSYAYLAKTLKGQSAKRKAVEVIGQQANEKFKTLNGTEFANWFYEQATALKAVAESASSTGTNYATNGRERKEWYEEGKEKRSYSFIPTPWESLTRWLGGGFELGDGSLLQGYTNRGKSWISSAIAVKAHNEGFGVLYYAPELSKKQQLFRFDTINAHVDNVAVRRGALENEQAYFEFLGTYSEEKDEVVPFIVKTMEDMPKGLSCELIEADLQQYENISLVVVDGLNLMQHGPGGVREGITKTSRKLRQIWGRYMVHGMVVHQTPTSAEKENMNEDDLGVRVPTPARLDQYSESIAMIQDNSTVLNYDQFDGIGKILLAKAREPNVGRTLDLRCNFNYGYITESTAVDNF